MNPRSCRLHVRAFSSMRPGALGLLLWGLAGSVLLSSCTTAETSRPASAAPSDAVMNAVKLADLVGTYALESINGRTLPFTVTHEGPGISVTSGTFTIRPDGTCTSVVAFLMPSGQPRSREVGATCTLDGSRLTLRWRGAGVTHGSADGDTFRMENEGQLFLYRRTR